MSQEVQKKRRKRNTRSVRRRKNKKNKIRMLKKILLASAFSMVLLTGAILLALFVVHRKSTEREPGTVLADQTFIDSFLKDKKDGSAGDKKEATKQKKKKNENKKNENNQENAENNEAKQKGSDAQDENATESIPKEDSKKTNSSIKKEIRSYIKKMTIKEKIAQLFVITPEDLTNVQNVVMAGDTTRKMLNSYPVGGLVYFKNNINSENQFSEMVKTVQSYSIERTSLPLFICVDEEGGSVSRISRRGFVNVPDIPDMRQIGAEGDSHAAYEVGIQIGEYLSRFQVNVDFAPVADVYSNPNNTVIGKRAFGSDPEIVAKMVADEVRGLKEKNIASTLKHFPGHGDTAEDSHSGYAYSYKSLDELLSCELIPFQAGIDAGAEFVMAGHISLPNVLGNNTPASLSYKMITEILRDEMGFDGIVITDSLSMGAISQNYSIAEAVVYAVQAGVDMLLMSSGFESAYAGILDALKQGKITEDRIDASLERILKVKLTLLDAS